MSSIDHSNLLKIAADGKGILRDEIVEALEAAADEIVRLQEVIKRNQRGRRERMAVALAEHAMRSDD